MSAPDLKIEPLQCSICHAVRVPGSPGDNRRWHRRWRVVCTPGADTLDAVLCPVCDTPENERLVCSRPGRVRVVMVRRGRLEVDVEVVVDGDSVRATIVQARRKGGEVLKPSELSGLLDGEAVQEVCLEAMQPAKKRDHNRGED